MTSIPNPTVGGPLKDHEMEIETVATVSPSSSSSCSSPLAKTQSLPKYSPSTSNFDQSSCYRRSRPLDEMTASKYCCTRNGEVSSNDSRLKPMNKNKINLTEKEIKELIKLATVSHRREDKLTATTEANITSSPNFHSSGSLLNERPFIDAANKKSNNEFRPFRIKRGSIIALRYKSTGLQYHEVEQKQQESTKSIQQVDDVCKSKKKKRNEELTFKEIWLKPRTGRDDGLNLIGKRIRCHFPKDMHYIIKKNRKAHNMGYDSGQISDSCKKSYNLEGEVIWIAPNNSQFYKNEDSVEQAGIPVKLLVDTHNVEKMKFLKVDPEEYGNTKKNKQNAKRRHIEQLLKGKEKSIVTVHLSFTVDNSLAANYRGLRHISNKLFSLNQFQVTWVIRKRVPTLFKNPKKQDSERCFVGDGNDRDLQQFHNWKWMLEHYPSMHESLEHSDKKEERTNKSCFNSDRSSFIGEVSDIDSKEIDDPLLVKVIFKKLYLPEQTLNGRMFRNIDKEIFDDASCPSTQYVTTMGDLIMIAQGVNRYYTNRPPPKISNNSKSMNFLNIAKSYNPNRAVFCLLQSKDKEEDSFTGNTLFDENTQICHRCRHLSNTCDMKQCTTDFCATDSNKKDATQEGGKWWCRDCDQHLKKGRKCVVTSQHCKWECPCCLFICDCSKCDFTNREKKTYTLMTNFKQTPSKQIVTKFDGTTELCVSCSSLCTTDFVRCKICLVAMHDECHKWQQFMSYKNTLKQLDKKEKYVNDSPAIATDWEYQIKNQKKVKKKNGEVAIKCYQCIQFDKEKVKERDMGLSSKEQTCSKEKNSGEHIFPSVRHILKYMPLVDFDLPDEFTEQLLVSKVSQEPLRVYKKRKRLSLDSKIKFTKPNVCPFTKRKENNSQKPHPKSKPVLKSVVPSNTEVLKPACSRISSYNPAKKVLKCLFDRTRDATITRELMKTGGRKNARRSDIGSYEIQKKINDRSTRANQRRKMKHTVPSRVSGYEQELLSTCEQSLRFGKSLIHGWGVFTDEIMKAGDIIIEYKGILIGNAVADKREIEYEKAKVGSDYMFRIDSGTVCDATYHGSLARFINASCTPNCFTKIITLGGTKRIVIYAKKNILPGEELCYDYKFDSEFNESKRIPCNCKSLECRGYMNWDKSYVANSSVEKLGM